MLKSTVCNLIGAKYGYRSYLEISTLTTGWQDDLIDKDQFTDRELLVYALPSDRHDKPHITYRTSLTTSSKLVRAILASHREPYDLVFVDPHHTYENSYEDLIGAFELVRPGGVVVVHDCNPPDSSIALPQYQEGAWCGATYWAFIDFVLGRSDIRYYTVDCDYGCGVVYKLPHAYGPGPISREPSTLELGWAAAKWSDDGRYQFFDRHRTGLLNLWTVDEFISREGIVLPPEVAEPGGSATNEESQLQAAS